MNLFQKQALILVFLISSAFWGTVAQVENGGGIFKLNFTDPVLDPSHGLRLIVELTIPQALPENDAFAAIWAPHDAGTTLPVDSTTSGFQLYYNWETSGGWDNTMADPGLFRNGWTGNPFLHILISLSLFVINILAASLLSYLIKFVLFDDILINIGLLDLMLI